jgi:type III secretion protein U
MSNDSSSEQKSLPASRRKLKEARRKGQVSHSQDFVNAVVVVLAVIYLWVQWDGIARRLERMLGLPAERAQEDFGAAARLLTVELMMHAAIILLPVVALAIVGAVLGNFLVKRGPVIAIDPITPRPERLNPAAGLKQLFSARSLVNLVKSLTKVSMLFAGLALVILFGLNALMSAAGCGLGCILGVGGSLIKQLMAVAAVLFLIAGAVDIGLQRWLFLRDMRMTRSEMKRETKELEGDPLTRRRRRERRQEVLAGSVRLGIDQATFVIGRAGTAAVGLRYVRGETAAPVVVAKAGGAEADELLAAARQRGLPVEEDAAIVARVADRTRLGAAVPEGIYDVVADIIVRNKLT